jgi:uncharacterized protein (TIGR03085 family)
MSDYARRERAELAALLVDVGPDAPTLCAGWATKDLAAHLVVRERRPDAAASALIPPLAGHGEHVRKNKAAEPYDRVVAEVAEPPWWSPVSNRLTDELANGMEFFIHHEDVRRAAPDWAPRVLHAGQQKALWSTARVMGRLSLRKLGFPVLLRAPGFGEIKVGGDDPRATVTGDPGELTLFVSGRQRASRVAIEGSPEIVEKLRTARLGL